MTDAPEAMLIEAQAPTGQPLVSLVFGRSFVLQRTGKCVPGERFSLAIEHVFTRPNVGATRVRPSLLERDIDLYGWRNFTDVVVRGKVWARRPVTSLSVDLDLRGSAGRLQRSLSVTGDRHVTRGLSGWRLTEPVPFTEMPLRYDRAYGGTDEYAEDKFGDIEERKFLARTLEPDEDAEMSRFSYPRNVVGKGYLVDLDGLEGLAWPNLEWPDEMLSLSGAVKPLLQWGQQPMPAAFDWFHHAWFPRCGYIVDCPATEDGQLPELERRLGLFEHDYSSRSITERAMHGFANGAHPYLARHRWQGDEVLRVSHMASDGDLVVQLPAIRPSVRFRLPSASWVTLPASLDLILVDADARTLTLLWRASLLHGRPRLPIDWEATTEYSISW